MNSQRNNRGEPPYYNQSRMNAPPPGAMSNAPIYGQGQYAMGPPTNGGWGQPQGPISAPKDNWTWGENTNSYSNFQEPNQLGKINSQLPPTYTPTDLHSVPVPPNELDHMANNNQYEQPQNSNQNWEWSDEWGWGAETPKTTQPDIPQEPRVNQAQAIHNTYQGLPVNPSLGIESSFNSMSLANQNREEIPQSLEQQPWAQVQLHSSSTSDDPGSFSRVSTWGSAMDHGAERGISNVGSEANLYHSELGERNTYADGASFTDATQPLQPLPSGQAFSPPNEPPIGASQPVIPLARTSLPPTSLVLAESVPLQREPSLPALDMNHGEPLIEPLQSEPIPTAYPLAPQPQMPLPTKANVPPVSGGLGHAEGYRESAASVNHQYGSAEYQNESQQEPSLPANASSVARYSESVSRSQSGTPSMERETERPDAEGGYENDQPVPVYQPPPPTPYILPERKVPQESPAGSRPSSRQAVITPSSETPMANPSSYQVQGDIGPFARPKAIPPTTGFYSPVNPPMGPPQAPPASSAPPVARGSQEAVGSENVPPPSRADGSNAPPASFPPSSQRMIPGSGSQGPFAGPIQQTASQQQQIQHPPLPQQQQPRPTGSITPVGEQRIVTGFAKNDPVPVPSAASVAPVPAPAPVSLSHQQAEETRSLSGSRSPPPPHRSETIGSENPRTNIAPSVNMPVGNAGVGNASADRSDDRISLDRQPDRDRLDREREARNHDRVGDRREDQSRLDRTDRERDRERDRDRNRDDERDRNRDDYGQSRYEDDDDERFSISYRERRYDHDRERDPRRYNERERGYSRDYDEDRRSGFGPADRNRMRDQRRRDPRRSDYYVAEPEMYERSGGRRSSLYEGDNNDPASDYNRSAYGFNTSRDARRRDTDRSRVDDPYYAGSRDRPGTEMSERAGSERDYHVAPSSRRRDPRDPRDMYYPSYYGYVRSTAYDPYTRAYVPSWTPAHYNQLFQELSRAYKHDYRYFEQLRVKNPTAYGEWYLRYFANQRYPPSVTTGPGTGVDSIAASEADRASVHSGRSSVNDDHPSMIANHSIPQTMRGSTTGLDQTHPYADAYQGTDPGLSIISAVQDSTPLKFPCAHVLARFSGNGFLIRVLPNSPKEGVAAHVELHDLNSLLSYLPSSQETRSFPGPLVAGQSHKQEVAAFCQQKIRRAMDETVQLLDRQSYSLLWELLLLLLRQNGTIVGTDIAELLLKDHEILKEPVVQDAPETLEPGTAVVDRTLVSRQTEASVTKRFRELLLFGHKKDALEWAMTQGLWGHALFLASKMDQRTYSSVMIRFANGLALTDPLQTLYQLMSGRQPTAVTSCGDDKWGDWRPHLAMILSNSTTKLSSSIDLDKKSIVTLGDTLAARGFLYAAHFCYLVAQVEFGTYSNKASKLVLLSSSASLSFDAFATSEAIQCTEVYEYARQLASPEFVIPSFQPYKFLYATRLAELGRPIEALQYCEAIGNVMTRSPALFPVGLMSQVCQMGSMLRYSDPQYLTENEGDAATDPAWLTSLEAAISSCSGTPVVEDAASIAQTQPQESEPQASSDLYQTQQQSTDQQYAGETQLQQPYFIPSNSHEQQTPYYNPDAGSMQPQAGQYGKEASPNANEQENSFAFAPSASQDYSSYAQNQYNNYGWQQPLQQQPQQQQPPWSHSETPATNGASFDYWGQQSNNLILSDKSGAAKPSLLTRRTSELPSEEDDDEDDDESLGLDSGRPREPLSPSTGGRPSFPAPRTRHVVFGGTYPIDRPMTRDPTSDLHLRRPPASLLTIKQPRTFSIDEPIQEANFPEASLSNEENSGMNSLSTSNFNTPTSHSSGLETSSTMKEDSKPSSEEKEKASDSTNQGKKGSGWSFGSWFKRSGNQPTPMKLPDDSKRTIIYDAEKKRWVNTEEDNEESSQPLAPPPRDPYQSLPSFPQQMPGAAPSGPASLGPPANNGPNRFGLKAAGAKRGYAANNAFAISKVNAPLLGATPSTPTAPQFFVPQSIDQSVSDDAASPDAMAMTGQPGQLQQQPSEPDRFMYNPAQMAPPMAPPGRTGLASRGRYAR